METENKRTLGRPKKTEEEKRETKRLYQQQYQKKRYEEDIKYREEKKLKALNNYHGNEKQI